MHAFLFALLTLFWGFSYVAIGIVVLEYPPILGSMLRVAVSFFLLTLIFVLFKKPMTVPKKYRLKVWAAGIFLQGFSFSLLFWGEKYVSPGLASILVGGVPIWTFIIMLIFMPKDDPFTFRKLTGVTLGIIGTIVIFYPNVQAATSLYAQMGVIAVVLVSISYGIGNTMNRSLLSGTHRINLFGSLYQQTIAALCFMIPATLIFEGVPSIALIFHAKSALLATLYLGFFSTALAWLIYLFLVKEWGALRTSVVTYLSPVATIIIDYFYFGNVLSFTDIMGGFIILVSVFLIQKQKKLKA